MMTSVSTTPSISGSIHKHAGKLVALSLWLVILGGYGFYTVSNGLSPLETLRRLLTFLSDSPWGPLLFVALYTVRPLILFSAALLTVGAGFLFGPVWGVVVTVIGANLGATLAYLIGRYFGQGMLEPSQNAGVVQRYAQRLRTHSFETVLTMRFLFVPYDLVNLLAGFLRVRYSPFLLATILGSLPGTVAFVLFGASTDGDFSAGLPGLDGRVLVASTVIFVASLGLSRFVENREKVRTR